MAVELAQHAAAEGIEHGDRAVIFHTDRVHLRVRGEGARVDGRGEQVALHARVGEGGFVEPLQQGPRLAARGAESVGGALVLLSSFGGNPTSSRAALSSE